MEKTAVISAVKKARETAPKRNFSQSFDLVINLKGLDLKKPEHKVDVFVQLIYPLGKQIKICGLVGPELLEQSKESLDNTIHVDDFGKYDKKASKKLCDQYDFFIAQANIMPKVAQSFGKVFGPRAKMPNPKAGCVVPPNANLKTVADKLKKTIRVTTKNDLFLMTAIGSESMSDENVAQNALTVYNAVVHILPNSEHNVRSSLVKLTMGKPVILGAVHDDQPIPKKKKGVKAEAAE